MSQFAPMQFGIVLSAAMMIAISTADAQTDPLAHCRRVVTEEAYEVAGTRLRVETPADLSSFPHGFLHKCQGNMAFHAVVLEDGSVHEVGFDHGVLCDVGSQNLNADLHSSGWRQYIITQRLLSMHYAPPRIADKPVCVKIERGWLPESPHQFWRPEEWKKYKGWK